MGNLENQNNQESKTISITSREEAIQAHEALRKYIFDSIENGEFEVLEMNSHHTTIEVDGHFKQVVWTANEEYGVRFYGNQFNSLNINDITDNERKILHSNIMSSKYSKIANTRTDKIKILEKQLEILKNQDK